MTAYHFLSSHPKLEVEIPTDPKQHQPSKNPNSILSSCKDIQDTATYSELSKSPISTKPFIAHPAKKIAP